MDTNNTDPVRSLIETWRNAGHQRGPTYVGAALLNCADELESALSQQPAAPALAKHQPCGCVICTCEDERQCHGCGAKHCGNRVDHPPYVAQQPAAVDDDYHRGLAFILARRDAITAMCAGPSERFVVERTFDALAAQQQG